MCCYSNRYLTAIIVSPVAPPPGADSPHCLTDNYLHPASRTKQVSQPCLHQLYDHMMFTFLSACSTNR